MHYLSLRQLTQQLIKTNTAGEIVEEEETTPTGPYRYSREEMVALREAQDKILPDVPKYECIMSTPILKAEPQRPR